MRENKIRTNAVYLSLGDREERTRNPIMAQDRARTAHVSSPRTAHEMVGDVIRTGFNLLKESGTDCVLEWNKGNHFKEPNLRTAKAFAWLMNRDNIVRF